MKSRTDRWTKEEDRLLAEGWNRGEVVAHIARDLDRGIRGAVQRLAALRQYGYKLIDGAARATLAKRRSLERALADRAHEQEAATAAGRWPSGAVRLFENDPRAEADYGSPGRDTGPPLNHSPASSSAAWVARV